MRERCRTNQKALHFDSNPQNLDLSSGFPVSPYSNTIKEQYYSCVLVILVRVDFRSLISYS